MMWFWSGESKCNITIIKRIRKSFYISIEHFTVMPSLVTIVSSVASTIWWVKISSSYWIWPYQCWQNIRYSDIDFFLKILQSFAWYMTPQRGEDSIESSVLAECFISSEEFRYLTQSWFHIASLWSFGLKYYQEMAPVGIIEIVESSIQCRGKIR